MRPPRVAAALLMVLTLIAAACTSDDASPDASPTLTGGTATEGTGTATPTSATSAAPAGPGEPALLALLVARSELPVTEATYSELAITAAEYGPEDPPVAAAEAPGWLGSAVGTASGVFADLPSLAGDGLVVPDGEVIAVAHELHLFADERSADAFYNSAGGFFDVDTGPFEYEGAVVGDRSAIAVVLEDAEESGLGVAMSTQLVVLRRGPLVGLVTALVVGRDETAEAARRVAAALDRVFAEAIEDGRLPG